MVVEPIRAVRVEIPIGALDPHQAVARRNGLRRLVRCLFAEGIVDRRKLVVPPGTTTARMVLAGQGGTLEFERLTRAPADTVLLDGDIVHVAPDGRRARVETPAALVALLRADFAFDLPEAGLAGLVADMDDSMANDAAARAFRVDWNADLDRRAAEVGAPDLAACLLRCATPAEASALLDRWGALEGHPFHPTWKSRPDLSAAEVAALSPEFDARVYLRLGAIRRDMVHLETMPRVTDANAWFADAYPTAFSAWQAGMVARGLDPVGWLPLPVHPWHLEAHVRSNYSEEIAEGILIVDGPTLQTAPSMSFRTMMPVAPADAPHVKLPIALWMTSEQRSLQAKSIHMGPRNSAVIETILAREGGFGGRLAIFPEEVAYHYRHAERQDDAPGRFLSVVFRSVKTVFDDCAGLLPVPAAALFAGLPGSGLPGSGRPFFTALVEAEGQVATVARIEAFFRRYVRTVVRPVIAIHLLYGIGLEAHQQNTVVAFDKSGAAVRTLVRDFGDGRSFAPLLRAQGLSLEPYRHARILPTVFEDDIEPVRALVMNACFVCHLHELALAVTREYGLGSDRLWTVLAEETAAAFEAVRDRVAPDLWRQERAAFLEAPWIGRSLLRMHMETYVDYRRQHGLTNPLAKHSAAAVR